jgi:probable F420-dependent oxidoreductase
MRFGVIVSSAASGAEWREKALRFETVGFDYLHVPDHVGYFDPFTAVASAAAVTERLRVGTLVLNVEFWNPLLLARAAVTTQLLTGGRFDLGLGAGHAEVEFEQAGLRYPPAAERVSRLAAVARVIPRLAAGETIDDHQLGLQRATLGLPPADLPLLIGGNGEGVLRVAGRHADVASIVGFTSGTGQTHSNLSHWSWEGLRDRIEVVRRAAQDRRDPPDVHVLVQFAAVTADPAAAVTQWLGDDEPPERHLDSPFVLVGDEERIDEHIAKLDQFGVTSISVFEDSADAIARIINELHRRS